jgi:ATP-dependent transcriptional regulator
MEPVDLAHQATNIILSFLPTIYVGKDAVIDKAKDMILERGLENLGSKFRDNAKSLLDKVRSKKSAPIEIALEDLSKNSEDPKAKDELQQGILKLLIENPELAGDIEPIVTNFNAEKVNQLSVGNHNTFLYFANLSDDEHIKFIEDIEQRRKEAANQEVMSCYNPSILPYYPERLKQFVTQNRADDLKKALMYLEDHRILLISGVGGVGKSTLARALMDLRPVNVPEPFWFSFYDNQDAKLGDVLEKLAAYVKAPEIAAFKSEKREPGKIDVDRLTGELYRQSEIWLFFDDLNTVLEDQQFIDKGIELFFSSLRYSTHNAKIIVTSRILPKLENGESLLDVIEDEDKQHLNGLQTDFAVDYLVKNKLDSLELDKLKELAIGVDGHPLALKLLVALVKDYGVDDILEDLSIYQEQKKDTILKARKLFEKLVEDEKGLLERISVYREPVEMKGIKQMFVENISPSVIQKLIDKSLLETNHKGNYWLHPLVQEFSYDDLENKKEAHKLAVKYYLSLPIHENPEKKEDLQPEIEAYYHACKAREYDLAFFFIVIFNFSYLLDFFGERRLLIDMYEKLLPNDHLKGEPLFKEKQYHGATLANLGLQYVYLGEFRKAIEYSQKSLTIARSISDIHDEEVVLGNLGLAHRYLDEPEKAIVYYKCALEIAQKIGNRIGERNHLGNLGLLHVSRGEFRQALEYSQQALTISIELGDSYEEGRTLGNIGLIYHRMGNPEKAIEEYFNPALKIARETSDRLGEGRALGFLGLAYIDVGEKEKALEYLNESLAIGELFEDPWILRPCRQALNKLKGFNDRELKKE